MTRDLGHESVEACQRAITSDEFGEWIAFYALEVEANRDASGEEPEPDQDQLGSKLQQWAEMHNARLAAKGK